MLFAAPGFTNCVPENYYGKVEIKTTPHFAIYYTQSGLHAIKTLDYIDSLAIYLEQAFELHKNSLGMKEILGASTTYHYRQRVPAGLYPIEIIDAGLLRNYEGVYSGIFGLTFPPGSSQRVTQIIIENDFLYGANCSGQASTEPFCKRDNCKAIDSLNYSINWSKALKVTVFHELYHAFQFPYLNVSKYGVPHYGFWLEASATGVEEIGAPEVDDYISNYLESPDTYNVFNRLGKSMEDVPTAEGYSHAVLYLFLYSKLGPGFDAHIFENFSKYPGDNFSMQLARLAKLMEIDAENLFHKYAAQIFYSGPRAKFSSSLFSLDIAKWPEWKIKENSQPILPPGAFDFVKTLNEMQPSIDFVAKTQLSYRDSIIWILSRLLTEEQKKKLEYEQTQNYLKKEFIAYPNPWNLTTPVNFGPLPEKSKGVEIRASNGTLLERIDGEPGSEVKWDPKKIPAPGILYYRYLPYGKNKVLIVQY